MNASWTSFLITEYSANVQGRDVVFPSGMAETEKWICAINHLAVLTVTGSQAGQFLQGQATCNVQDVDGSTARLGAFCTPQGKVISTFLLVKWAMGYGLILPEGLLAKVKSHLQKYILRADVQLLGGQDDLCLLGMSSPENGDGQWFSCQQSPFFCINFGRRQLSVLEPTKAIEIWTEKVRRQNYLLVSSCSWRYQDIARGLPWLTAETSEQFIPQMLNLDKLDAISFTKGCYTGQEVVARTHYLGQAKRSMLRFAVNPPVAPSPHAPVADGNGKIVGRVLDAARHDGSARLLCVLPNDTVSSDLHLPDFPDHTLSLV